MSLDLFARLPKHKLNDIECYCTPVNIDHLSMFTNGAIHLGNITHNLSEMAGHVFVDFGISLYDTLWRANECCGGDLDILRPLWQKGLDYLMDNYTIMKKYNPSNGYGDVDTLIEFTRLVIINSEKLVGIGVKCEADR